MNNTEKLKAEKDGLDVWADLLAYAAANTPIEDSGCVHACGKHHAADIGLQGSNIRLGDRVEESADVYVGGHLGQDGRLATKVMLALLLVLLARARLERGPAATLGTAAAEAAR